MYSVRNSTFGFTVGEKVSEETMSSLAQRWNPEDRDLSCNFCRLHETVLERVIYSKQLLSQVAMAVPVIFGHES